MYIEDMKIWLNPFLSLILVALIGVSSVPSTCMSMLIEGSLASKTQESPADQPMKADHSCCDPKQESSQPGDGYKAELPDCDCSQELTQNFNTVPQVSQIFEFNTPFILVLDLFSAPKITRDLLLKSGSPPLVASGTDLLIKKQSFLI
jgi:hypothetical protein